MNVTNGDERTFFLQVYPSLEEAAGSCCTMRVARQITAEVVVRRVVEKLGSDPSVRYELAEVQHVGGEESLLEPTDSPAERVRLWPERVQERHLQAEGYYFVLRKCNVVDDLCDLPVLSETTILATLRMRFRQQKIYTYAGSMLVAVNPFKFLPIYNPKSVKEYEGRPLGELEPHVFAVADVAYRAMLQRHRNQCVLISGESGSGKTQSTNFLIHCLTALSQRGALSQMVQTILGAGPVLEAFGNARTAYNNNSSRFGKYIQLNYLESGVMRGAVVQKYLLEKSRLVSREKNERNYHVFYYLLAGASEEKRRNFKLLNPEDYVYLKQESIFPEDEVDLHNEFKRLQQAMEMVGFLPPTKRQIFAMLSAILYLGNVTYQRKGAERDEGLEVGPPEVLKILSNLLQVKQDLLVKALTQRKSVTANDTLILPYSIAEAITARDSMAKSLYSALFDWIVLRINHALLNKKDLEESHLSIGILDIFGFEDFENNSFEQFCINYANEQLQYYFTQHLFKLEQEEYQAERISWSNIEYTDNVGCINLISKKPTGLFHLLDEESNFPHATDKTLLAKFKQQHQGNSYFIPTPVLEPAFVVRHFAGNVKYQLKDFREKNMDHMRADIMLLLRSSNRAYVRQLIAASPAAMFRWGVLRAAIYSLAVFNNAARHRAAKTAEMIRRNSRTKLGELRSPMIPPERLYSTQTPLVEFSFDRSMEHPLEVFEDIFASFESRKSSKAARHKQIIPKNLLTSSSLKMIVSLTLHDRSTWALLHQNKKKKPPSIGAQFQASLNKLMESLGKAEPFFISCIRSNANKMEMCFDNTLVLQQLRYTGMLETVRIQRSGYSAKYTFQEFARYFWLLLPKTMTSPQRDIANLLQKMGLNPSTYQIGRTKVFMKEPERQKLQDALNHRVLEKIIYVQCFFRTQQERRQRQAAAIAIQRCWRRYQEEKRYRAAIMIQALWRGSTQRKEYLRKLENFRNMKMLARGRPGKQRFQQDKEKNLEEEQALQSREGEQDSTERRSSEKRVETREGEEFLRRGGSEVSLGGQKQKADLGTASGGRDVPKILLSGIQDLQSKRGQSGLDQGQQGNQETSTACQELPASGVSVGGVQPDELPSILLTGNEEAGRKEIKRSPCVQERPNSLHLDTAGTLQRFSKHTMLKDKAEKWKERRGDSKPQDGDDQHLQNPILDVDKGSLSRRISVSLDDVSNLNPSATDSIQKVRLHYRKRRLAHVRSALRNEDIGDMEYWSFPLPPMSPGLLPRVDIPDTQHQPLVEIPEGPTETSKFSTQKHGTRESPSCPAQGHQTPTTPEKSGFFRKILKRLPHKEAQMSDEGDVTPTHAPNRLEHVRPRANRNSVHISRATRVSMQWNASLDREVTSGDELRQLDDFLATKVNDFSCGKNLSLTEVLFIKATMEFRENIKGMYSLQNPCIRCRYKDLMTSYQSKVTSLAGQKQKTEVHMVVNLFQSVLDGFVRAAMKRKETDPEKPEKKKNRRDKNFLTEHRMDHVLSTYQVNIMQSCDQCTSYIWGMEKAYMCSSCKMVCHKKCLSRIIRSCSTYTPRKDAEPGGSQVFGVHVRYLTDTTHTVPIIMAMLLEHVELNGLYTEGIYRKSGAANRIRELHQQLENDPQAVCLEEYPIHTITGLIKQWLRELPEPLMTFTHYSAFLHAVELPEKSERLKDIYTVLDRLPPANFNTLERLIFHMIRVAKEEPHNRMSTTSLAIIFAPCILRNPDTSNPLESMTDVSKTTMCLELLLNEQMRLYKEKLMELKQLEFAEALAIKQLKLRRQNTLKPPMDQQHGRDSVDSDPEMEKMVLRIKSIKQEKDEIACTLPELTPSTLDQDSVEPETPGEEPVWILAPDSRAPAPMTTPTPCQSEVEPSTDPTSTSLASEWQSKNPKHQKQTTPEERTQDQPPVSKAPGDHKRSSSVKGPLKGLNIPFIDENL
ncbi:unconventional myosin-IXb-like isoform X2 [Brienomyrus brachyistius]|uniref:unconventional myosin-IXb-like isoform X2 n=1 Tax=Brienomyrus brachyistius TaxID=42636 RepID=UPI0020B233C5|nr:unconventional myosin-IXb-like isoform X2 [Brienomyrus brachyistius]